MNKVILVAEVIFWEIDFDESFGHAQRKEEIIGCFAEDQVPDRCRNFSERVTDQNEMNDAALVAGSIQSYNVEYASQFKVYPLNEFGIANGWKYVSQRLELA